MLFKNANIFVDGRFQHGSFRVENGRFSEILSAVPEEDGVDLENQYVIPGLIDVHNRRLCRPRQNGTLSCKKWRDQLCSRVHDAAL